MNDISLKVILIAVLALAAVILVLLMIFQRKRKPDSGRSRYIGALYALIEGRRDDALRLLTEAVRGGETDVDAYIQLGNLLREKKMPDKALQIHRSLTVRRDMGYDQEKSVQIAIAQDLADLGKMDRAIAALDSIHKRKKDHDIASTLHRLYHRSGDYENAFDMLKSMDGGRSRTPERDKAAYLACVASIYRDRGDLEKARQYLKKARKSDPGSIPAIYLSGALEMEQGKFAMAADDWTQLLMREPGCLEEVMPRLEKCLFESGEYDSLERILGEMYLKSGGDQAIGVELASYHIKKGETDRGLQILESENSSDGYVRPSVALRAAALYLEAGREREARKVLDESLSSSEEGEGFRCGNCGMESAVPHQYCSNCSRRGRFDRSI